MGSQHFSSVFAGRAWLHLPRQSSDPETQQGMHFIRFQFSNSCTVKPQRCEHLGTRAKAFTLVGFHIGGSLNKWMFTLGVHISEVLS